MPSTASRCASTPAEATTTTDGKPDRRSPAPASGATRSSDTAAIDSPRVTSLLGPPDKLQENRAAICANLVLDKPDAAWIEISLVQQVAHTELQIEIRVEVVRGQCKIRQPVPGNLRVRIGPLRADVL